MFTKTEDSYVHSLDFRIARAALPSGSSPLMAFGGKIVEGQYFTVEEIEAYIVSIGWSADDICVFERSVMNTNEATEPDIYAITAVSLNRLAAIQASDEE